MYSSGSKTGTVTPSALSAGTQTVPPDGHFIELKLYHLNALNLVFHSFILNGGAEDGKCVEKLDKKAILAGLFRLGWSDRAINRETGIHRVTVKRYRAEFLSVPEVPTDSGDGDVQSVPEVPAWFLPVPDRHCLRRTARPFCHIGILSVTNEHQPDRAADLPGSG